MRWGDGFIAADWGTTNRRAYLIGADGSLESEMEDGRGILSIAPGGFPEAVAELRARLGDLPLLLGGMVGSNRGWIEAPYVPCPATREELAAHIIWAEPGRTAIVPGLSYLGDSRADVMRGEEVQLFGALAAGLMPESGLVCHPGTHNKWVVMREGRVDSFRTVMTGELFSLLKEHSILSDLLQQEAEAGGSAFEKGVLHGLADEDLTAELFSVRARVLLEQARREDAASYTSGLLIGADLRSGLRDAGEEEIMVMGRPELTGLYAEALRVAGWSARELDGEQCFIAGATALAEAL